MKLMDKYFTQETIRKIRDAIATANGNEVFFLGQTDEQRKIVKAEALARGNDFSAPALLGVASPGDVVIHNHPGNDLTPSQADVEIAACFGDIKVGFYIINNQADDLYIVVEAFTKKKYKKLQTAEIAALFSSDGQIAKFLQNYEYRQEQVEMACQATESFNDNLKAVIEAGTGTGKTLAYLLPAIFWSCLNQEKVVVSTNTINLQEQLFYKDIPLIKNCLNFKFKAALLKGRKNYLCKRKLEFLKKERNLDDFPEDEEREEFLRLIAWADKTRLGTRADLNCIPSPDNWERLEAERESCSRKKCVFFRDCFFYKSRREVLDSNLVVVNHHLLLADIAANSARGYFKEYNRLIIDEAHNIEEIATSHFGVTVTKIGPNVC